MLEIEKRFGKRSMGVVEVIHEDDGTDAEITEVEVGAKTVLHWNLARRSILSGAVVVAFPTDGDASDEIIPYLAYGRLFDERWMFQSSARLILPVDDVDTGEAEFAGACTIAGPNGHGAFSRHWSSPRRCLSKTRAVTQCSGRWCRNCVSGSPVARTWH